MAHYRHLPVWKAAMDLAVHLEHAVRRMQVCLCAFVGEVFLATPIRYRHWRATLAGRAQASSDAPLSLVGCADPTGPQASIQIQPGRLTVSLNPGKLLLATVLACATPAWAALTVDAVKGTVTDTTTFLMWDQCVYDRSGSDCATGTALLADWPTALITATTANAANAGAGYKSFNDWRLPNKNELESITKLDTYNPAIDIAAFPPIPIGTNGGYGGGSTWTSTTSAPSPSKAWVVHFQYGYTSADIKSNAHYVRLVRSGQSLAAFDLLGAPATYTIGGTATGLGSGKSVVLQNNAGDNLTVSSNASFTFATAINSGSTYAVTVLTQPAGQTCVVGSGSGTANANVSNVTVICLDNSYTVTFDANGGTGSMSPQSANYNVATALTTNAFTRTGYTFANWASSAGGAAPIYANGASYPFTSSTTLYAQWTAVTYSVTYNGNSATSGSVPADQTKTYGVDLTLQSNIGTLARTGYTFADWNTANDGNGTSYAAGATYTTNAALALYAKWTAASQTLTFSVDGGSAVAPITQDYGTSVSAPTAPTKSGYTFGGWYNEVGLTTLHTFSTMGLSTTIYAKWTALTYTVTYNANSATSGSVPADQTKTYGVDLTLQTNSGTLARTGYTFAGWNTAANGGGTDYAVGATYSTNAALTLYAKWTVNSYTVTFDKNTGTVDASPTSKTATYNGNVGTLPTAPTKTGYTFASWNTLANGTGTAFTATTAVTADTTLYAKWTINNYTVSFNSNGGSAVSSQSVAYNATATAPSAPTKTGYTFAAWYSDSGLSSTFAFTTAITADTTLYAKWTTTTYTIGGTASGLGSGKSVVLQNNAGDNLTVNSNASFTFATAINSGSAYAVTVLTQPTGQTCVLGSGSGTANANVSNVTVTCTTTTYTIGGTASGLGSGKSVVLQNNAGDNLTVNSNASFTFATAINSGSTYAVTVLTQPTGQTCVVGSGSGTANANVSNMTVTCLDNTIIGSTAGGQVTAAITGGSCLGYQTDSTSFTAPVNPPPGQIFPYGVFGFTAISCGTGGTVTITLTYPNALPPGTKYWKSINGSWVDWTSRVTISGKTVVLTLTDGAYGDTNPNLGEISDPSGPGYDPIAISVGIPTLSEWGMLILSGLMVLGTFVLMRRRQM